MSSIDNWIKQRSVDAPILVLSVLWLLLLSAVATGAVIGSLLFDWLLKQYSPNTIGYGMFWGMFFICLVWSIGVTLKARGN